MRKMNTVLLLMMLLHFHCFCEDAPNSSPKIYPKYISNKAVGEIPEVKELFSTLRPLLENALDNFKKMPQTNAEQLLFAQNEKPKFQEWTNKHFNDLINIKKFLPQPNVDTLRYGRNLVLINAQKGIYVFLHLLNPHSSTPKHWHSQNGVDSLAFATTLSPGGVETKWKQEQTFKNGETGEEYVQLIDAYTTPIKVGELVTIPADYGSHQISNTTDQPLVLFEIYFEPQKMDHIDVPVLVMDSKTDHVIDTVSVTWLNELNLLTTATREDWPAITQPQAASAILANPKAKVFAIVNKETTFVPVSMRQKTISSSEKILKGPDNRYLLVIGSNP